MAERNMLINDIHKGKRFKRTVDVKGEKKRLPGHNMKERSIEDDFKSSKLLNTEEPGFLRTENGRPTHSVTQNEIFDAVDLQTARKMFSLSLETHGPYQFDYDRSGRYVALAGQKGHLALFDWNTKNLLTEFQVHETVHAIKFLHNETMFAAAQGKHTYVYNKDGVEVHCLKPHDYTNFLEFLPYHFLLVSHSDRTHFLSYQDMSTGVTVARIRTIELGKTMSMRQNTYNAIISLGSSKGVVSLWAPSSRKPLVEISVHRGSVASHSFSADGRQLATGGADGTVKLFDLRTYKELRALVPYRSAPVTYMDYSQRGQLALAKGNEIKIYSRAEIDGGGAPELYFLGVGTALGWESIVVPGSGEPNIDSWVANPYSSRTQDREAEIKQLLDKLRPEMISLDPNAIGSVMPKQRDEYVPPARVAFLEKLQTEQTQDMEDTEFVVGSTKEGDTEEKKKKPKSKQQDAEEKQLKKRSKIREYAHNLEDTLKAQAGVQEDQAVGEDEESYDPLSRFKPRH